MYALSQKLARLRVTDITLAIESRVECQIGELRSPTIPLVDERTLLALMNTELSQYLLHVVLWFISDEVLNVNNVFV